MKCIFVQHTRFAFISLNNQTSTFLCTCINKWINECVLYVCVVRFVNTWSGGKISLRQYTHRYASFIPFHSALPISASNACVHSKRFCEMCWKLISRNVCTCANANVFVAKETALIVVIRNWKCVVRQRSNLYLDDTDLSLSISSFPLTPKIPSR